MIFFQIRDKANELGGYYSDDDEAFIFPSAAAKAQFDAWMIAHTL